MFNYTVYFSYIYYWKRTALWIGYLSTVQVITKLYVVYLLFNNYKRRLYNFIPSYLFDEYLLILNLRYMLLFALYNKFPYHCGTVVCEQLAKQHRYIVVITCVLQSCRWIRYLCTKQYNFSNMPYAFEYAITRITKNKNIATLHNVQISRKTKTMVSNYHTMDY